MCLSSVYNLRLSHEFPAIIPAYPSINVTLQPPIPTVFNMLKNLVNVLIIPVAIRVTSTAILYAPSSLTSLIPPLCTIDCTTMQGSKFVICEYISLPFTTRSNWECFTVALPFDIADQTASCESVRREMTAQKTWRPRIWRTLSVVRRRMIHKIPLYYSTHHFVHMTRCFRCDNYLQRHHYWTPFLEFDQV